MDADVVVVGGGVMGLATAWRAASAGLDTVVLERFRVGHERGSSHGPTRVFRVLYGDATYVRMAQASIPLWRELEDVSGSALLRITGGLQVDVPPVTDRFRGVLESCGVAVSVLDPDERRRRFPWLEAGDAAALWVDEIGVIAADDTVGALRSAACAAGADVREETAAESIEIGGGVTVATSSESVRAKTCVIAAGAWAPALLGPLGIELPVRVTREQVLYFGHAEDVSVPFLHGVPYWVYGVPGSQALKVAEHHTGADTTPDERSFELDETAALRVRQYVERVLPTVDPEPVGFDTCLYTNTPDEGFVIDRRGPLLVCSPCSGHGFKFAPLIGEIVAKLVMGREPPLDVAPFALSSRTPLG